MSTMNRLANCKNVYQGAFKRVLVVCSAGLLRSPTAALVLSQEPFNYNTRAAGISEDYALVPVDEVLLKWADEVVCMSHDQEIALRGRGCAKTIYCLNIPDNFEYRNHELKNLIFKKYVDLVPDYALQNHIKARKDEDVQDEKGAIEKIKALGKEKK